MAALDELIKSCVELGSAQTIETLGLHSGEISMRKARDTYGKWFMQSVADGKLYPCRVEDGRAGTRWFRVVDILALKVKERMPARIIWK